jgi:hypothetical protein
MEETHSLLPAALLRGKTCAEARLSKRAAVLLRRECDQLGASLLKRSFALRAVNGGPLEASDLWEAAMSDHLDAWLIQSLRADATVTPRESLPPSAMAPFPGLNSARLLPPPFDATAHGSAHRGSQLHTAFLDRPKGVELHSALLINCSSENRHANNSFK